MKTLCTNCWGGLVSKSIERQLRNQGKPVVCYECMTSTPITNAHEDMMKTNKQVINALTKDAIDQAFVISAVEYYAKAVLADGGKEWSANAFINYDLWKCMAEHAVKTIENQG